LAILALASAIFEAKNSTPSPILQSTGGNISALNKSFPRAIPIHRRKPEKLYSEETFSTDENIIQNLIAGKYHAGKLINYHEFQYYFELELGTPGKKVTMVLDTGSHEMWIPKTGKSYDATQSSSAYESSRPGSLHYGKGACYGYYGTEVVNIPSLGISGITHPILFIERTEDFGGMQSDGLTGFSNSLKHKNFVDYAYESGQIDSPLFSFEIKFGTEQSMFYAGNPPAEKTKGMKFLKAVRSDYWSMGIDNFQIDGESISAVQLSEGVVDSGTSLLIVNTRAYNNLVKKIIATGATVGQVSGGLGVYCKDSYPGFPVIKISSGDIGFELEAKDYLINIESNICLLAVQGMDRLPFTLLGDVFMRKYFVTYDKRNNKMGFSGDLKAPSKKPIDWVYLVLIIVSGLAILIGLAFFIKSCMKARQERDVYHSIRV